MSLRAGVSIIVNVFNGARFLRESLESVRGLEGDFEPQVLVVDDASEDETSAILEEYPEFELVRLDQNVGAAAAISRAFERVRGEFVARLDYDDRYHPSFLVDSLSALERHPEAAFVCASAHMIDSAGVRGAVIGPADYGELPGCCDRFASMLRQHFVTAPTILGRTAHWRRAIPVPAKMNFCDWYMNLTMAETAPVVVLDQVTADYRIHPLNMHATKVRSGMGERVTMEVLDRFLVGSPRGAELAPHSKSIQAHHYADWGDKYFGAGMDADASRCYGAALRCDPVEAWKSRFIHRYLGLLVGRPTYERAKGFAKRLMPRLYA